MRVKRLLAGILGVVACLALAGCPTAAESEGVCEQPPPGASAPPCDDVHDVPSAPR